MWLVKLSLRRPITIMVAVIALALCSLLAVKRMRADIFPDLNLPAIIVAQPYGGMDPEQMESYLVHFYEHHFLYVAGIEHVESKAIQGAALIKIFFHPGTDMSEATAQVLAQVNRTMAYAPRGTVPPFIARMDAGSVPVGYLVFKSETRSLPEIQEYAFFRVRPLFSTLPGVSSPPPFGGNARTVIIHLDPDRLDSYHLSPENVVAAVSKGNLITPAGNLRIEDLIPIAPMNGIVPRIEDLGDIPLRMGAGPTVYLRDVGWPELSSDIAVGYALINGRRTVYIPVVKRADASTLDVVDNLKNALPSLQAVVPEDVSISFEFDQSHYVKNSLRSLSFEIAMGALLTGLMVLLFLHDFRSALIVLLTIPFSLLTAVVGLWAVGQTINIMTLSGLALAVGVLVDESTVAIENIHSQLAKGKAIARAVLDSAGEVAVPRLVAMLTVLAVFIPSFFMVGVGKALFVPLALSVGFSMVASYFLSSSFVNVLSIWMLKPFQHVHHAGDKPSPFERFQTAYGALLSRLMPWRRILIVFYLSGAVFAIVTFGKQLGTELFPSVDTGQFQIRLRAPDGTRIERTEVLAKRVLDAIREEVGPDNLGVTLGYVGTTPSTYAINMVLQWSSGPHEAVLRIAVKPESGIRVEDLKERLRRSLPEKIPGLSLSFEAGDIVSQVMSMGSPTPLEITVAGHDFEANREYAARLVKQLQTIPTLRDIQYGQPLDYPTVNIKLDRVRAGQMGLTAADISRSLIAATSSSRFVTPMFWREPHSGDVFQLQLEVPQSEMSSLEDVKDIPMQGGVQREGASRGESSVHLRDVARVTTGRMIGEYDHYNNQRLVTITANVAAEDLGNAARRVDEAIARTGPPPRGMKVSQRGQVAPMRETLAGLQTGLWLTVGVILLLLAANFQSFRNAIAVVSTVPASLAGVLAALWITHTTVNVQSFLGAIMAIGVAVANAILLVTFAQTIHLSGMSSASAAVEGGRSRLRPILMTSIAMMAGMLPMALGLGEGGEQTAPLGRALIGGLAFSTVASLFILPFVFTLLQGRGAAHSPSLDPEDPESRFHEHAPHSAPMGDAS